MRKQSRVMIILAVLLGTSLLLSACQSAPAPSGPTGKAEQQAKPAAQVQPTEQPKASEQTKASSKPVEQAKPELKEPYKIGLLTTLTGPAAFVGNDIRDAVALEIERINAAGGINGHALELVVEDDAADPSKSVTGLTKLIRQDKVVAVTGPFMGPLEASSRAVAEREQTPFVVICPTSPEVRAKGYKYSFNIAQNEMARVGAWVDLLKEKKFTRVAGISSNDPILLASFELLKKEGPAQGIDVSVLPDAVEPNAIDLTPEVTKLKDVVVREKAQVVVSGIWPPATPTLLKTMKQLGVDVPAITYDAAADPFLFQMGGDELNGLMLPGSRLIAGEQLPASDPQRAVIVDFKKRFEAKTNRPVSAIGGMGRDALNMIADALKVAGEDKAKLRDAIEKTTNFVGVNGIYTYKPSDHEGVGKESFALFEVKDKKFVFLRGVK